MGLLWLTAVFGSCALAEARLLTIALSFGFSIFVLVYAAASFSGASKAPGMLWARQSQPGCLTRLRCVAGGHLNPAVSIGLACGGRISVLRAFLYIIAQCLGACTGAAMVKAVGCCLLLQRAARATCCAGWHWPDKPSVQVDPNGWHAAAGGINSLASGITQPAGWGLETVLTTTLVFTVFCATDAERGADTAHLPVREQDGKPDA